VIALATSIGITRDVAVSALETARTRSKWRLEVTTGDNDVTVVNDAYNANPDSMRAALETLAHIGRRRGAPARTFAVLGEMRELGASSGREHDAIGRLAARLDISQVVAVGDAARQVHLGAAQEDSWDGESLAVPDVESAVSFLRGALRAGDVVLVKASRAAELEKVALALLGDPDIGTATEADA
ncbi:MAG: UDP-N-acetylmuramoyl-tripeptide--D-alanyl-D-alanine ligase, partial [Actinomycetota bacterium]|nr:UDP-N-acetylmuramoyl-tripeptide--D-alanyl-D-alanine ligase [Actinomycetota bacterium]